jgi:plasmid stabilization system protein ParE
VVTVYKKNNVDNINNIRREARRHFRNKQKGYLKSKFDETETKSKIKNIRDLYRSISDFKKGYHSRTNIVKNENGDLFTDSHSILGG